MNKNNIDKFFQERFKGFGEVPDEKVWESIKSSLDQKKNSRRILPLWWKLGGVAAALAILFYIINPFENTVQSDEIYSNPERVETPAAGKDIDSGKDLLISPNTESEVVQSSEANDKELKKGTTATSGKEPAPNAEITDRAKADPSVDKDNSRSNRLDRAIKNPRSEVTRTDTDNGVTGRPAELKNENQSGEPGRGKKDHEIVITGVPEDIKNNLKEDSTKDEVAEAEIKAVEDDPKKKSIFDETEEEEEEVAAAKSSNKWSVGPSVAPVYFSSFGEGSPIHPNFVANSKSGNLNLSYGLAVSYDIAKKLSIRSGIHKVDYGYDTNDILFSSSLAASTSNRIDNIDYALTSKNLLVQSAANTEGVRDPSFASNNEIAAPSPSRDGRMVQQFGYLEVPLELNYALVERKVGVNIIGGFSSLFLVDNTVSLESNGGATEIGEANNINDLNFSTNIGFGINYNVTPKVRLNLEPMFKYQLNTFSDTSGNFQPFSVGVYSGLNFRF